MQCDYFDAGVCRSCSRMGEPYPRQLESKDAWVRGVLAPAGVHSWDPPHPSRESAFRNKAKLVVGGTSAAPTLGILDPAGRGVDLSRCGLYLPGLTTAIPELARFVTSAGLTPYDVPRRSGELKHLLLTESPDGELLVRFVLRSTAELPAIRASLPQLTAALPRLAVVSVNLQPEHKAIIEGAEEILLTERETVPFRLGDVTLHLGPRAFFQTNTAIGAALYATAREWLAPTRGEGAGGEGDVPTQAPPSGGDGRRPQTVVDLYCGVGGFALHLAAQGRDVLGIEISPAAVAAARESARELREAAEARGEGLGRIDFMVGDASSATGAAGDPDVIVVNPPRRGIGAELADALEHSLTPRVLYSSCNADSLARDLARMPSLVPVRAQLFDMFPQTTHHEVMVLLERR
ncbi:MAG: methyltransferase domain-containing protein [bacterium]|nr:methyltransferase domain-containing protein [bacterium]